MHYSAATSISHVVQRPESTEASSVGFSPFAELSGGHALIPSTGSLHSTPDGVVGDGGWGIVNTPGVSGEGTWNLFKTG